MLTKILLISLGILSGIIVVAVYCCLIISGRCSRLEDKNEEEQNYDESTSSK